MATVTYVFTINHVAKKLGEDPELLQAIVSNDDNLSYGSIISVYDGTDEALTALTDDGVDELRQMLAHARRTADEWNDFLEAFVDDEELIARIKAKSRGNNRAVTTELCTFRFDRRDRRTVRIGLINRGWSRA